MKRAEASSTAKVIAAATILLECETKNDSQVLSEAAAWCQVFLSGTRRDRWLAWSAKQPRMRKFWRWIEWATLPGIIEHYAWRKRWIESLCRQAIADGCSQVVVVGAGFDTLSLRLAHEFPAVSFIELDHPATSSAKWQAFAGKNHVAPKNLSIIAVDLAATSLPEIQNADNFSFWIIEGVLMYLEESAVDKLFAQIAETTQKRQVLFSVMRRWSAGESGFRSQSRLIDAWLSWRGEPFRWSISPEAIEPFLQNRGYAFLQLIDPAHEGRVLCGENLVLAEMSGGNK